MAIPRLRIFVLHASHHLTDHAFNGDGLVAWGFLSELARRGHRIYAATDRLDVNADLPPNLTVMEFPRVERNAILHYLSYIQKVRAYFGRVASTDRIDVVHQMNPVVRGLSLSLLGKHVPVVLGTYVGDWVRLPSSPNYSEPQFGKKLSLFAKSGIDAVQQLFATKLILATPHALKRIPLPGIVAERVEFMHHGVDTELYCPSRLSSDPPAMAGRVLYLGSIQQNKGVLTLAEAFASVCRRVDSASLVMVGDGRLADGMKARLAELGIDNRVTFAGRASRAEVAGWLRSCDVLCAPSFGEPYGQNILEAMATGKPIVKTTEGGHRHIGDAEGAISVEPGNVEQLANALSEVLTNRDRAAAMGMRNRLIAEQQHAWPRVTDRLEEIYWRAKTSYRQ